MSSKSDTVTKTVSRVAKVRKERRISVADLARSIGVSRQTIYAIEDGTYVPNTSVALRLGRALGVTVDDLFSLDEPAQGLLKADLLSSTGEPSRKGQPVRLCQVEDRMIAVPGSPLPAYLPRADGVIGSVSGEEVSVVSSGEVSNDSFLLAGCDPALSLVGDALQHFRLEVVSVPAASQRALDWLREHKIHAAGSHLLDPMSGTYNIPFVRRLFDAGSVRVITFAAWQQGIVMRSGNPKNISCVADLARRDVRFVNREEGSGSRKLLESGLRSAGIESAAIPGFSNFAFGHLEVARRISTGEADAGIATESAARCFGLDFLPLADERFDLTFSESSLSLPTAQAFLNTLASAEFRTKLRVIAGYDTTETGKTQL